MTSLIARFVRDDRGAVAIEYGLITAIVGMGIIVGLEAIKDGWNAVFNSAHAKLY
jgi:pilus assembly protein Flp/PilA